MSVVETAERSELERLTYIVPLDENWLRNQPVSSIEEQEPQVVDNIEMRVFNVEIDVLTLLSQSPATSENSSQALIEELPNSELSLHYTLWIGVEDGFLHRVENVGRFFFPYFTEEKAWPPYDYETNINGVYIIWDHGMVDEIDLPEEVAALVEP